MKKFENVDILSTLEEIMLTNTEAYRSDWYNYDVDIIKRAADSKNADEKNLLWISRKHGTHLLKESEVYVKDTAAHNIWTYWLSSSSQILAYEIEIVKKSRDKIIGNVYQLDYVDHATAVKNEATDIIQEKARRMRLASKDINTHISKLQKRQKVKIAEVA